MTNLAINSVSHRFEVMIRKVRLVSEKSKISDYKIDSWISGEYKPNEFSYCKQSPSVILFVSLFKGRKKT